MDGLAEKLHEKLRQLEPVADHEVLDLNRSRSAEQEILDILGEPSPRGVWLADLLPARMNSVDFCGANFSLQRRLQPTFGRFFIQEHRLKPMLQAEARATSHVNLCHQALPNDPVPVS